MTENKRYPVLIVWLATLSISFFDFQPFLVGSFVTLLQMSEAQAGFVASINMFGMCAGLGLAALWGHKWPMSRLVLTALLLIGIGYIVSGFTTTFEGMSIARFVTGFGEGLALAAAVSAVAHVSNPDRLFAFIMFGQSLYGVVGLVAMPYILGSFGLRGVFFGIAALALLTLPFFRMLPDHSKEALSSGRLQVNAPVVLVLASLLVLYISMTSVWAYYERIGTAISISASNIGAALSAGLLASMIGALVAAAINDRFRRLPLLSIGVGLTAMSVLILYVAKDFAPYVVSVMLLFGATGFAIPYYMGQLADFDRTGRLATAGYITVFLGSLFGPAMGAALIEDGSYSAMILTAAALAVVALVLIVVALRAATRAVEPVAPEG